VTATPPEPAPQAAVLAEAWALKQRAQEAWTRDPAQTRSAADTLAALAQRCAPGAAGAEPGNTLAALASWAEGLALLAEGELPAALARLQAAQGRWLALAQPLHAAQVQVAQLVALSLMGRFDEAVASGAEASTVLVAHDDVLAAAKLAINLGSLEMQRDRYNEAARHYKQAGVLAARVGARQYSIMADIGLADALADAGHSDEARLVYERASMRAQVHGLALQSAQATRGRALLELSVGRVRDGLAGLVRAREASEDCGTEHDRLEVEKYLADAYLSLRLLPEAMALYDMLLPRLRAQAGESTLPWVLLQLANAQALSGKWELARRYLDDASAQWRKQGNSLGLAWAGLAQAELLLAEGEPLAAENAAKAVVDPEGTPPVLARRARLVLAACARRRGDPAGALQQLEALQVEISSLPLLQLQARCWHEQGLALATLGQAAEAAVAYEQAIACFEDLRAALPGDDLQQAVLADHLGPYVERLSHALACEPAEAVLHWQDRYRARVLSERLEHAAPPAPVAGPDQEDTAERHLRLRWLQQQRQRRIQDGEGDLPAALQAETTRLERELLETARRRRVLAATAGVASPSRLDLARLQQRLRPERALVEYGVVGDELFAVVVTASRVEVARSLARWPLVEEALRQLRFQLETLRGDPQALLPHMPLLLERARRRLQQLHGWLLAPLERALAGVDEWVIVPHGALHALPFAALHDGQGWLNERVSVRMAASAAVAALPPRPAAQAGAGALVAGDTSSLAHVAREVETVAASVERPACLMGPALQVDATARAASQADLVHLACHGEFRADNAQFSALHLADGAWTAMQIAESPVPARLVVMSACDTGLAERLAGDESVGLVRAFLLAGAHEVVASLWAVDDAATADFMRFFYRAWADGRGDTAAALRTARRQARALRPHPFHWGAFVLHGTPADRGT
jgi:CHAT domain-containing protein